MLEQFIGRDYSFTNFTALNDALQYLDYVDAKYDFDLVNVDPDVAYRYQGNLFGLFAEMGISPSLFLFTMYLNGYNNPVDFAGDRITFKLATKPPIPGS